MSDQELQALEAQERELWAKLDVEEKLYKRTLTEWSRINDTVRNEKERRKYFAEFQKAQNIGAALAGGATTLAECTQEAK